MLDTPSPVLPRLDAAFALISRLIPDVLPKGTTSRHLCQSALAGHAMELARRLDSDEVRSRAREGRRPELAAALVETAEKLHGELLHKHPTARVVSLCERLEEQLEELDEPAVPLPVPTALVRELAKDLGVDLGTLGPDAAAKKLLPVLAAACNADKRAGQMGQGFVRRALEEQHADLNLRRMRFALVGYGLPSVRKDDSAFHGDAAKLWPALTAQLHREGGTLLMPWKEELLKAVGIAVPPYPDEQAHRASVAAKLKALGAKFEKTKRDYASKWGNAPVTGQAIAAERRAAAEMKEATERFQEEERALRAEGTLTLTSMLRGRVDRVDDAISSMLTLVDEQLQELAQREPGSLRHVWLRELRIALASNPAEKTWLFSESKNSALSYLFTQCRTFGIAFDFSTITTATEGT